MKKIIYTLLAITLVISACKKEDEDTAPTNTTVSGYMDNIATNYNALATVDNGNCIPSILSEIVNDVSLTTSNIKYVCPETTPPKT